MSSFPIDPATAGLTVTTKVEVDFEMLGEFLGDEDFVAQAAVLTALAIHAGEGRNRITANMQALDIADRMAAWTGPDDFEDVTVFFEHLAERLRAAAPMARIVDEVRGARDRTE